MSNPEFTERPRRPGLNRTINARAGGLLLIWIGVTLLVGFGWGVGLIGVGIIILLEQLTRRRLAVEFEWSWVGAGAIATGLGVAITIGFQDAAVPILLIVVGGALIASTLRNNSGQE
jgi:hypothetical protein